MESNSINCSTSIGSNLNNWTCFVVHYVPESSSSMASPSLSPSVTMANLSQSQYDDLEADVEDYDLLAIDPAYELRYGLVGTVLLSVAYALIFIVGLLGNISVVIVVKKSTMMRSPTNRFIVNLAYADLLVNFLCLPFTLIGNLYPGKSKAF